MTLSDLQRHSLLQAFSSVISPTAVQQLTRLQLSRSPSAVEKLLVNYDTSGTAEDRAVKFCVQVDCIKC